MLPAWRDCLRGARQQREYRGRAYTRADARSITPHHRSTRSKKEDSLFLCIVALDAGIVDGVGLDVLEEESVMRREAGNIITNQIIEDLHNAATQEEAGTRTPEGIKQIERLFRNERLLSRPNVVFTPHVAFNSVEAVERMLTKTVENIRAFLAGKPINVVTPA